jgi:hypothetical protein
MWTVRLIVANVDRMVRTQKPKAYLFGTATPFLSVDGWPGADDALL